MLQEFGMVRVKSWETSSLKRKERGGLCLFTQVCSHLELGKWRLFSKKPEDTGFPCVSLGLVPPPRDVSRCHTAFCKEKHFLSTVSGAGRWGSVVGAHSAMPGRRHRSGGRNPGVAVAFPAFTPSLGCERCTWPIQRKPLAAAGSQDAGGKGGSSGASPWAGSRHAPPPR